MVNRLMVVSATYSPMVTFCSTMMPSRGAISSERAQSRSFSGSRLPWRAEARSASVVDRLDLLFRDVPGPQGPLGPFLGVAVADNVAAGLLAACPAARSPWHRVSRVRPAVVRPGGAGRGHRPGRSSWSRRRCSRPRPASGPSAPCRRAAGAHDRVPCESRRPSSGTWVISTTSALKRVLTRMTRAGSSAVDPGMTRGRPCSARPRRCCP